MKWLSLVLKFKKTCKIIAQFELYKRCSNLPGSIAEFGVFKGNSLIRLASFRNMLEMPQSRNIYGFDMFDNFPTEDVADEQDREFIKNFLRETDWSSYILTLPKKNRQRIQK